MNSRIVIKFAKDAGFNPCDFMGSNLELFEKYTELIVRQCIAVADSHGEYEVMDSLFECFEIDDRN